jgi:hypothetical protein
MYCLDCHMLKTKAWSWRGQMPVPSIA